jgi:hypothetical protein
MGQMESEMGAQPDNTGLGANPFLGSGGGMPQGFPGLPGMDGMGGNAPSKSSFTKSKKSKRKKKK